MRGGTTLTISGVGFDTDNPQLYQVLVGNFECEISAEGVQPTSLTCDTTDSGSSSDLYNQLIKVFYNSQEYIIPGNPNFDYLRGQTPLLFKIYPYASPSGTALFIEGRHRVVDKGDGELDLGDFKGIFVGESICNIINVDQNMMTPLPNSL